MENRKFIDPQDIPENLFPIIILIDDRQGFIGWGIKSHSKGRYNHAAELYTTMTLANQGWLFKSIPLATYMKPRYFLKFWTNSKITVEERSKWLELIQTELKQPWWWRKYDLLGVIGQLIHLPFINNPASKYCSERIATHLKKIFGYPTRTAITPSDINWYLHQHNWLEIGYWFSD